MARFDFLSKMGKQNHFHWVISSSLLARLIIYEDKYKIHGLSSRNIEEIALMSSLDLSRSKI